MVQSFVPVIARQTGLFHDVAPNMYWDPIPRSEETHEWKTYTHMSGDWRLEK